MFDKLWILQVEITYALAIQLFKRHEYVCFFIVENHLFVINGHHVDNGSDLLFQHMLSIYLVQTCYV